MTSDLEIENLYAALWLIFSTLLNFGKRYEDDLRVIFDQWPKLHLGLDALSDQKILNGIKLHTVYLVCTYTHA